MRELHRQTEARDVKRPPGPRAAGDRGNKAQQLKGQAKEQAGKATGDEDLQAEDEVDQAKGNLKQAGEKVKDAFKS